MSLSPPYSPKCCQHVYVVPVKAMFFLCDCLCDQPYPTYSAILGMRAHSHYSLDAQTGTVESRSRGEIPCSLEGTKYRFPSQMCHDYPLELLCTDPTHIKQQSHYTVVLPEPREDCYLQAFFVLQFCVTFPAFRLINLLPDTQDFT